MAIKEAGRTSHYAPPDFNWHSECSTKARYESSWLSPHRNLVLIYLRSYALSLSPQGGFLIIASTLRIALVRRESQQLRWRGTVGFSPRLFE